MESGSRSRSLFVPGRSTRIVNVPINRDACSQLFSSRPHWSKTAWCRMQQAEVVGTCRKIKIMALTLTPDKADYKPGEHAIFTLQCGRRGCGRSPYCAGRDQSGCGGCGSAFLAMQTDLTPDIPRNYFYGFIRISGLSRRV